jgi:hypothetical protein
MAGRKIARVKVEIRKSRVTVTGLAQNPRGTPFSVRSVRKFGVPQNKQARKAAVVAAVTELLKQPTDA